MTVGFVMLAHTALDRAADVAEFLAEAGCPVVIHVDRRANQGEFGKLLARVSENAQVSFAKRRRCDWGTWSLVQASRDAAETLLKRHSDVSHVMLISGACLPIKPIAELKSYLAVRAGVDFIESVTVKEAPWAAGGLSDERFSFSFPFSWKKNRRLFDFWVDFQRRIGRYRKPPESVTPHLGSQWWCLSRGTLQKILTDPRRKEHDRFFRRVWIPDESYYQSLVRLHGANVESRSLTFSKFGFQGRPHVFYDDHLAMLTDSSAFFARKIWPGANRLYDSFLRGSAFSQRLVPGPRDSHANRVFSEAVTQRTEGRAGLAMAGRFPREGYEPQMTAEPYCVFHGFGDLFLGFQDWAGGVAGGQIHGHLFAPDGAEFADGGDVWAGALSSSAKLRDYNVEAFLKNLIWNARGARQSFLYSARDNQTIIPMMAMDRNARVYGVSGAWVLPLLHSGLSAADIRSRAAELQAHEAAMIDRLRERRSLARHRFWTLAEVLERPTEPLRQIAEDLNGADAVWSAETPGFVDLTGLPDMLQALRNAGMNPHLAGAIADIPAPIQRKIGKNVVRLR